MFRNNYYFSSWSESPNKNSSQVYQEINIPIEKVKGVHAVYLIFKGEEKFSCNLDWFHFEKLVGPDEVFARRTSHCLLLVFDQSQQEFLHNAKRSASELQILFWECCDDKMNGCPCLSNCPFNLFRPRNSAQKCFWR